MQTTTAETPFLAQVGEEADRHVAAFLATHDGDVPALAHRPAMARLLDLVTVFTQPGSRFFRRQGLGEAMARCLDRLEVLQGPTGLFDGTNLCSPPDSAFTLNDVCMALRLVRGLDDDQSLRDDPLLGDVHARLAAIVGRSIEAMVAGGVHTPNHRWELCAALAQINLLQPRQDIGDRIGQWLAEGIDQLPDGMYSERSPLYATAVTNPSLLTIADSTGRPELLDHVRRNLTAFLPWFNPDGTVESVFSRRQDQWMTFGAAPFLHLYRRFAVQDGRADFAAAAAWLASFPLQEPAKLLALTRLDPWLAGALPPVVPPSDAGFSLPLPPAPTEAALESCGAYRFRSGHSIATVYGGCDPLVPGVGSGLATNPTFLSLRHGGAVLSDVRLSRSFFDLGPFRSQATSLRARSVVLSEEVQASFYQPLSPDRLRADGIYALEHEGRFSAAMGFSARAADVHRLATDMTVAFEDGQVCLDAGFDGTRTAFALELTFRPGGVLDGVQPATAPGTFRLVARTGSYRVGGDVIEFGPGLPADPDAPAEYNPGESYRYLGGTNAAGGIKVYITGWTSGRYRFTFRGYTA